MKVEKAQYEAQRHAALVIQLKLRSYRQIQVDRNRFLQLKKSVQIIENKFIATKAMRVERNNFLELRAAVVFVQQRFLENFYTPEPANVHSHPWLLSSRALPGIDDT